ncbi:hypothetical protein ACHAPI_008659 [Fusarium lateritium]
MAEKNTAKKDEKTPPGSPRVSRTLAHGASSAHIASSNTHFDGVILELMKFMNPAEFQARFLTGYASSSNEQESSSNSNNRTPQADKPHNAAPEPRMGGIWNCPVASPGFVQVNGNDYDIDGPLSRELAQNAPHGTNRARNVYNNPINMGFDVQHNGHHIVFDDVTGATEPELNATYNTPICLPSALAYPEQTGGRQINGNTIKRKHTAGAREDKK